MTEPVEPEVPTGGIRFWNPTTEEWVALGGGGGLPEVWTGTDPPDPQGGYALWIDPSVDVPRTRVAARGNCMNPPASLVVGTTIVPMDTVDFNAGPGGFNSGSYTVGQEGYYDISARIGVSAPTAARVFTSIIVNGIERARGNDLSGVTGITAVVVTDRLALNVGDVVSVGIYASLATVVIGTAAAGGQMHYLSLSLVDGSLTGPPGPQGPPGPKAAEPYVYVTGATAQAIPTGTWTILGWEIRVRDPLNIWNGSGAFTIPEDGLYLITAMAQWNGAGSNQVIAIYQDSTLVWSDQMIGDRRTMSTSAVLPFTAGMMMRIYVFTSPALSVTTRSVSMIRLQGF